MRELRRAVHLDFHTMPGIEDFAAGLDPAALAQTLADARVDYVNVFAKCNLGFAYYPTKIGIPYPGLEVDLLGRTVEECRRRGIGVTAYFNVGLDHEMARLHRDWTVVNADGQVIYGDRTQNFFRNLCLNTPYRDYLLGMITEVVQAYPIDGIFLDCMVIRPCSGNECAEAVRERGGDPLDQADLTAFAEEVWLSFTREVKELVGPDRFFTPNGLPWAITDDLRTHGEIECLPSGSWGYDYFPARVAYARNLDPQVLYMTGRFVESWGEFGGLKEEASLRNDCWDAISNAAQPSIGDHTHPRDGLEPAVYEVVGRIYREVEALEPWTLGAVAVADVGVLVGPDHAVTESHDGAVRMLGQLHVTYDLVDERHDLERYRVIILPDDLRLDTRYAERLDRYLAAGGKIISTGTSGLRTSDDEFALDEWRMGSEGLDPATIGYYSLPDGRLSPYTEAGVLLRSDPAAERLSEHVDAYFQRTWDGFHGYFYTPPDRPSGRPAAARSGPVIQIAFRAVRQLPPGRRTGPDRAALELSGDPAPRSRPAHRGDPVQCPGDPDPAARPAPAAREADPSRAARHAQRRRRLPDRRRCPRLGPGRPGRPGRRRPAGPGRRAGPVPA
ncbi:beta-galactosidase trimerization domain-containing protein [Microlunatus sp. GCM10028923]|uniref:beta-galactosidase trimerization domain-containing protein n=1 Tax=Microlunatus sp. GCM10028923 TaxID=3273400 RepID=UPI003621668E